MKTIRQILAWLWDWRPVPAWRVRVQSWKGGIVTLIELRREVERIVNCPKTTNGREA